MVSTMQPETEHWTYPAAPPETPGPKRGPGWTALIGVGVGTAVLASALTAGAVNLWGGGTPAGTQPASSSVTFATGSWTSVAAAVGPSVVSVIVQTQGGGDEGSGVVLDTQGHILTNNHVVSTAGRGSSISVALSDGRIYAATVVGTDPSTDLAVLKLTSPPADLRPAAFADSSAVHVGDAVMAVGNPLGLSDSATTGIVSALDRPVTTGTSASAAAPQPANTEVVTNAIQTDAAINPGNSGGALVNANGQVIGITSSIASLGSSGSGQTGNIGLGFAIPANQAKDVADQLISTGTVAHAYLGASLADDTVAVNGAQRQAAVIGSVAAGAPAVQAGLRAGDAVIAVDGQALEGADSLVGTIRALDPGTRITLTIVRGGQQQDVTVTLAARAG